MKIPTLSPLRGVLAAVTLLLLPATFALAQPPSLIANGKFTEAMSSWNLQSFYKQPLVSEIVTGPEAGGSALRVTIAEEPGLKKYAIVASQLLNRDVAPGEELTLRFKARSPESLTIAAMIHQPEANPARRVFYREFGLTPEWKAFEAKGSNPEGFAKGDVALAFFLSFGAGQIEIADLEVTAVKK